MVASATRRWRRPAPSGYSLQGTRKALEGASPRRDAQFRYISTLARRYLDADDR
jgi:hypothetical protein